MHIVLLHQYHHNPDCPATCRHYDFTAHWAERHRVTIVGSDAWESKRITSRYPWVPDGVELKSVHVPYDNRMSTPHRLVAFASFTYKSRMAASAIRDADVIIGTSTPLSVGWAAHRTAADLGVPFVFEVRDLWPDFPIEMGAIGSDRLQRWLRNKERDLYHVADHVVTLSPDMTDHVRNRGVEEPRVSTIIQGSDVKRARFASESELGRRLRAEHNLGESRVILYAGAFGRANAIPTLLAVARSLAPIDDLVFVFIGHGFYADMIAEEADRSRNVRLIPPVPRHAIFGWFALADLSLVSFVDVPSVMAGSPAKLFDSLATGCPVIVTNAGWTKKLVEDHRCGWYTPAEDADSMASTIAAILDDGGILKQARHNARRLARDDFDRVDLADHFEDILVETVRRHQVQLQPT